MTEAVVFAAVFIALYIGHSVGDHWSQTTCQALTKGRPDWTGRLAAARHVLTLTLTKAVPLTAVVLVLDLPVTALGLVAGLGIDAASHWWADRRSTLARLARLVGRTEFYELGSKVVDDNGHPTHLGTGAYALDQSWHMLWLGIGALIIAAV
ncbi:transcriptional regulator [Streptomyces albogriseolus]|uniref:transcriptional regulator n=1 Tax=Streptomyces sp. NPDC006872 TaxID=3155720 RepID=UPI0033FA8F92